MREKKLSHVYSFGRTIALFVNILVWTVGLSSCDSQNGGSSANIGKLRLNLYADTTSLKKGVSSNPTKALSDELEKFQTIDDYKIEILQDEKSIKTFDRFDQMPSEIELPEGIYTLVASKGDDKPAAFENPFFEGSTSFTVKEAMSTPLDVTCTLANARITVDYTEEFKEAYADYTVLLSSPFTKSKLEIEKTEVRAAYMQVAKKGSELGIAIRLKKTGETEDKTYKIPTALSIERRQNIRLIFKTDGEVSDGIGLDILLDDEMTEKTLDEGIPDFMWQQFDNPTLRSENFGAGEFTINPGGLQVEPSVGFQVPAGIGGFFIDTWKEDDSSDADTIRYNLASEKDTDYALGVSSAIKAGYRWNLNNNGVLTGIRSSGQLHLQTAINNLSGPKSEKENSYVHHIRIYACDNLPKNNYSSSLELKVIVNAAGAPIIICPTEFPSLVVEGDVMDKDTTIVLSAENGIDKDNSSISINGKKYVFSSATNKRELTSLGIEINEINNKQIKVVFHPAFTKELTAPENGGSTSYSYRVDLQESGEYKRQVSQTRIVEVKAPEMTWITTNGDAFAKRIVLRMDMPIGRKEKLEFQYRLTGNGKWTYVQSIGMKQENGTTQCVDTLKSLVENTKYDIRAIYNRNEKRTLEKHELLTETSGSLPNAQFENWSIKPDENGSAEEAATNSILIAGKTEFPYRYWEVWQPWESNTSAGWNTLNLKTTQDGITYNALVTALTVVNGGFPWTRYNANSGTIRAVGSDGYAALVRTVGWGSGCSAVGETSSAVIKKISAGELYLGSCSDKEPEYGIGFTSRPTGFSFQYKYITKDGKDSFVAEMVVLASDGTIIATAQLPTSKAGNALSWSSSEVRLNYKGDVGRKKAYKMYIRFKSSLSTDYEYLRSKLMVWPPATNLSNGEYIGSQLYIDNVELIYE